MPWSVKRERLLEVFSWLAEDFTVVTLAEVAALAFPPRGRGVD